jgi:hypothetical protein
LPNTACTVIVFFIETMPHWFRVRPKSARLTVTSARWYALSRRQQKDIESPAAWLTKVASRICLDLLGSARARRERYVGDWLPEPLPGPTARPSSISMRAAAQQLSGEAIPALTLAAAGLRGTAALIAGTGTAT